MNLRLPILALAIASLLAVPAPAGADEATVTLVVDAPSKIGSMHTPFHWDDTVALSAIVDADDDGVLTAVDLLAHVADARDATYTLSYFDSDGDGTAEDAFVDEVNGVATDFTLVLVGYFWATGENDVAATVAFNDLTLEAGDTISLDYTGYPVDA